MSPEPEVAFILDAIASNYGSPLADVPLQRIDRDNSRNIDTDSRVKTEEYTVSNYVGARTATTDPSAIGTEYDQRTQAVVNVRIGGGSHYDGGHIDPDGTNGVVWRDLKRNIRRAILQEREFPNVSNRPNRTYTWIEESNVNDLSAEFSDEYRWEADFAFRGYDDLP